MDSTNINLQQHFPSTGTPARLEELIGFQRLTSIMHQNLITVGCLGAATGSLLAEGWLSGHYSLMVLGLVIFGLVNTLSLSHRITRTLGMLLV